ncbi:hypothetical protein [Flavobacterium sp.]|uniref:hypothetical protein n=1 Tax=Flavobacterium sp. TaxID=239 RepID=UPI0039E4316C
MPHQSGIVYFIFGFLQSAKNLPKNLYRPIDDRRHLDVQSGNLIRFLQLSFFVRLRALIVAGGHLPFEDGVKIKSCLSEASSFDLAIENELVAERLRARHFCFFCCQTKEGPRGSDSPD